MKNNSRLLTFVVFLSWILWGFLSYKFRFDRLYGDAANYLFLVINDLSFFIAHTRPAGVLIEYFPLYFAKNNASMEQIVSALSYNEAFSLIAFSAIACFLLKDAWLALTIMLVQFIGNRINYFNPVSELYLASPMLFIAFGLMSGNSKPKWVNILFAFCICFMVMSHPLFIFILPIVYFIFFKSMALKPAEHIFQVLVFLGISVLRYKLSSSYDQGQVSDGSLNGWDNFTAVFIGKSAWENLLLWYVGLFLLLVLIFLHKTDKQQLKIKILVVVAAFTWLFTVLVKYIHYFPDTLEPFERYLYPGVLIIGALFYHTFRNSIVKPLYLILVISILLLHSTFINDYGARVQTRNGQLRNLIQYAQDRNLNKVGVGYFNFNPDRLGHDWIMSSESMLLSKMTGNGKLVQCFVYESIDKELLHRWQPFEYIYFPWITMNNTTLNPEYFRFAEQPVKLLNTPDTLGLAPNSKPALEINFAKSAFKRTLPFQLETVEIVNSGDRTINSGGDQNIIQITGFWKNDKGTVIDNPSVRFLADVDKGKIRQLMIFQLPPPGKYSFTFQLSVNNQVFCELNTIHNLKIED